MSNDDKPPDDEKGKVTIDLKKLGIVTEKSFRFLKDIQEFQKKMAVSLRPLALIKESQAMKDLDRLIIVANQIKIPKTVLEDFPTPVPIKTVESLVSTKNEVEKLYEDTLKNQKEIIELLKNTTETLQTENKNNRDQIKKLEKQIGENTNAVSSSWKNWKAILLGFVIGISASSIVSVIFLVFTQQD